MDLVSSWINNLVTYLACLLLFIFPRAVGTGVMFGWLLHAVFYILRWCCLRWCCLVLQLYLIIMLLFQFYWFLIQYLFKSLYPEIAPNFISLISSCSEEVRLLMWRYVGVWTRPVYASGLFSGPPILGYLGHCCRILLLITSSHCTN